MFGKIRRSPDKLPQLAESWYVVIQLRLNLPVQFIGEVDIVHHVGKGSR